MSTQDKSIQFWATVARVQTLVDGGIRLTLDLPEDAILQAARLMEAKRFGLVLNVNVELVRDIT